MMAEKYVVIDMGGSRISAMAAEVQESGIIKILSVESLNSEDVRYGIVDNSSGASFKINALLKLLKNSAKIPDVEQVSVSVGAKSMKSIHVTIHHFIGGNKVVTEELLAAMHEEAENKITGENVFVFDVIPISYSLDGQKMDEPAGKNGIQITGNYCIVYGNVQIINKLDDCFDRTGVIIENRSLAMEALSAVLLDDNERDNGCALINFGATTTSVGIYFDGALQHLLIIPLGGKNITKDIQELGIGEQNAEKLKCLKGCALKSAVTDPIYVSVKSENPEVPNIKISTEFLSTIIEARLDELMHPIIDLITKHNSKLNEGIVITGGGSKLNHLTDFLNEKTDLYVRFGNHNDWIQELDVDKYSDRIFSQLIGTITLAHEYRKTHPLEDKKRKPKKEPKIKRAAFKDIIIKYFEDENIM
ncbi:MAG: cell division protein FtsA [Paludibacter sp.]|nr:cell division protein FtsA [Paludibacter sp.]